MEIYVSKQNIEVGSFYAWLLKHIGIEYSLEKEPAVEESVVEQPEVTEPEEETIRVNASTAVVMYSVMEELSPRAYKVVRNLLKRNSLKPLHITAREFTERFSFSDLRKEKGCGIVTAGEISYIMSVFGYKMRE